MLKMFELLSVVVDANVDVNASVRSKAAMLKQERCRGVEKRRGSRKGRKRLTNIHHAHGAGTEASRQQ